MKLFRLLLLSWMITFTSHLIAQDIHFSLFNMSPLSLNPAHTGAFEGTARIGGIYRDQWASIISDQFQTPSFYVDAPIIRGFGKYDWVGVGAMLFSDKAGSIELGTSGFLFSAAYHRSLSNKNSDNILTLGIQGGSISRTLNTMNLLLGSGIDIGGPNRITNGTFMDRGFGAGGSTGGGGNPNQGGDQGDLDNNFFDISAGLMLRSKLNDETNLEAGISINHITQGEYGLLSGGTDDRDKRPMTMNAHGRVRYQMNEKWHITPGLLFRTTEGTNAEVILQGWLGRRINDEFVLNFGSAYRFSDAAQLLVGVDYNEDLRVALSYDVNLSSLNNVSDYQGGFELAAYYIIKLYKSPKANPAILCPKF